MKSIRTKLILAFLLLLILATVSTVTLALSQSFKITDQIIETQFEERLISANNMLDFIYKINLALCTCVKMVY